MKFQFALVASLALAFGGCTVNVDPDDDGGGGGGGGSDESFSRVVNNTGATLVLVGEDEWTLSDALWAPDCGSELLDLTIEVDGDSLVISASDLTVQHECRVKVRSRDVHEVECDGDGDLGHEGNLDGVTRLTVNGNGAVDIGTLETDRLDLIVKGNGEVQIDDLQADMLYMELSGEGDVYLGGDVTTGEFYITGNGNLTAQELIIQDLMIEMSGDGNATITVENTVSGEVSGNGSVDLYGGADGVIDVTGSGLVNLHD